MKLNCQALRTFLRGTGLALFIVAVSASAQSADGINTNAASESLLRNGKRDIRVHDPSTIVKCKDEYWLFATGPGVQAWRSKDLVQWEQGPRVFSKSPT